MRLFISGAGYSGRTIARELGGQASTIIGTTRTTERFSALTSDGIQPLLFDGIEPTHAVRQALRETTHLLQSIAPGEAGDPLLRLIGEAVSDWMPHLQWVGYLSTVGVYGDHQGNWVDEETVCRPVSKRSRWRDAAERSWITLAEQTGLPIALLRLSGIYGPGRNALIRLQSGTARRLIKPGQVFNRIHVDDIAGATAHLAAKQANGIWNVTDNEPAPPQDVIAFGSQLMGVTPPPEIDFETADLTPMARSFYGENKRVSNAKLRASGYDLRYPDYRAALTALWESGEGAG
ncbi:MAG: SDR family oxidoreductase [Alphaproteobacteria bacterium]|nr:SDR family oxidoreductase [Alphaproteobacteria bacterium]